MACVYRAAAVIATDKEDLVERVKQITGTHCLCAEANCALNNVSLSTPGC